MQRIENLVFENVGIPILPEVTNKQYSMFDDGGVEIEVMGFLEAITRLIKPKSILETGLYTGISAMAFGNACRINGIGHLDTVEINADQIRKTADRIHKMGLSEYVTIHHQDSLSFNPTKTYQLMLLDSIPEIRFQEIVKFYPYLDEGGYVFIHDLHRHCHQHESLRHHPDHAEPFWPYGEMPEQIKQLVRDDRLRPFHFGTPRGLTGFYKTHPEDWRV